MRNLALITSLFAITACPKAADPEPVVPEPVVEVAPEPAPEPEPEPEPEPTPPPEPENNADLQVTIGYADGTSQSGHVKRIERSSNWGGDEEWYTDANHTTVTLEGNGTEVDLPWTEIPRVDISIGSVSSADCSYESDYVPWMYTCEIRNTANVRTRDGSRYEAVTQHKWRFTFDDNTQVEFWLYKHRARMQDSGNGADLGMDVAENYSIYGILQEQLRNDVTTIVNSIRIE